VATERGNLFSYLKILWRKWRPPNAQRVLIEAAHLHKTKSIDVALAYIKSKGLPSQLMVTHLFRANDAHDDRTWQTNVNAYLAQYGVAPVELVEGDQKRFYRLTAPVRHSVHGGPLISVIMTTFNAQRTVAHSVRSILNQTWRNIELIIVDDASTDHTLDRLNEFSAGDGRVRILRNGANVGPYVSKNLGLSIASGEYITCHDADDWAHPQRLEKQINAIMMRPDVVATVDLWLRTTEDLHFRKFGGIEAQEADGVAHIALISSFFRMDAFRKTLGHWDCVRFGADHELFRRARKVFGDRFTTSPIVSAFALDADGSLTNHPIYGTRAGPNNSLSLPRIEYKKHWESWHKLALPQESYMEFPQAPRTFAAPEIMLPDPKNLEFVIRTTTNAHRAKYVDQNVDIRGTMAEVDG
jgi:glycosyltransferase involved in cell wall biosynthesis